MKNKTNTASVAAMRDYSIGAVAGPALLAWRRALADPAVAAALGAWDADPSPRSEHELVTALHAAGVVGSRDRERIINGLRARRAWALKDAGEDG